MYILIFPDLINIFTNSDADVRSSEHLDTLSKALSSGHQIARKIPFCLVCQAPRSVWNPSGLSNRTAWVGRAKADTLACFLARFQRTHPYRRCHCSG